MAHAVTRNKELMPAGFEFPTEDQLQAAVQTFGMLGDPTRLRILWTLLQGEQTVNRLAELVGVQQPTVSQHLAKLRMARLVRQRRQGSHVFYEVDRKHVRPLLKQALGQADGYPQNLTRRSAAASGSNRRGLDRGVASALSGWTLNHGHSLPAATSVGLTINTPAVVGSITIGILLLAPVSRLAGFLSHWFERRWAPGRSGGRSLGSTMATLAAAGIALGAILFDISRFDPSGPALAWSPGVAVLSLGAASILGRVSQAPARDDRVFRIS